MPRELDEEAVVIGSTKQDGGCRPDGSCNNEQGHDREGNPLSRPSVDSAVVFGHPGRQIPSQIYSISAVGAVV